MTQLEKAYQQDREETRLLLTRALVAQASLREGAGDKNGALADLDETLKRLGTDYLDLWQIHDVRTKDDLKRISNPGGALEAFVEAKRKQYKNVSFISAGSSLKFCRVAEGNAQIYPRLGPTMEWDTGAGQAIAIGAGAEVFRHDTGKPLSYNKENLLKFHKEVEMV